MRRKVGVGQSRGRKDGQLLSSDKGVKSVDGRNAGLYKLVGILSCGRIHGAAVNIEAHLGNYLGTVINGIPQSVKHPSEHILRYSKLHLTAGKAHLAVGKVDACRSLKKLHKGVCTVYFKHSAAAFFSVFKLDFSKLVVFNSAYIPNKHKRACHLFDCPVFLRHPVLPPLRRFRSVRTARRLPCCIPFERPLPLYT